MVRKMSKSRHGTDLPIIDSVTNPSTVGGKLVKVPDERFHQIGNATIGIVDRTFVYHNFMSVLAKTVPCFRVRNDLVNDLKVGSKEILTYVPVLGLETLAGSRLLISIASDISAFQDFSKLSLSNLSWSNQNVVRGEVGTGSVNVGHG